MFFLIFCINNGRTITQLTEGGNGKTKRFRLFSLTQGRNGTGEKALCNLADLPQKKTALAVITNGG